LTEAAALLRTLAVVVVVVLELSSVFELGDIVGAVKFLEWLAKIGHTNLGADVGNGHVYLSIQSTINHAVNSKAFKQFRHPCGGSGLSWSSAVGRMSQHGTSQMAVHE